MSVFTHLSLSPINIAAALCSTKAYNTAYAKGEQMINETMYARGAESSIIREIFSYGLERKAQIGAENVFDFSLGNPSVPAPAAVAESIKKVLELPSDQLHGYTPAPGLPQCRAAVTESLNRRFGTNYEGKVRFKPHISIICRGYFCTVQIDIAQINDTSEIQNHPFPFPRRIGRERLAVPSFAHGFKSACTSTIFSPGLFELEIMRKVQCTPGRVIQDR